MSIRPEPADIGRPVRTEHLPGVDRIGKLFSYNMDHGFVRFGNRVEPEQILLHALHWDGERDPNRSNPIALESGWYQANKVPVPEEHQIPVVEGRMGYT